MNYAQYFAIEKKLKNQGFDFERSELIKQFTEDKKSSLKELTATEYREFLKLLNSRFATVDKPKLTDSELRQRKKVIALFCQMGYTNSDDAPDMKRINAWIGNYGHLKHNLNYYFGSNLTKLVTQAQEVYNTFLRDLKV
jgi:hypothetical protein